MLDLKLYYKDTSAIALLLLLITVYLLHFLGFNLSYIFGDLGDARLNNYFLEHGFQFFLGNHQSFWSPPFFFPAEGVLVYSDNHMGTLPFYAAFRMLGYGIETSYQLWMILIFMLNGLSAYIVLRLFKFNLIGSFFGALLFAISAPVMLKTGHFQMIPRFMVPVIFYAGLKFLETLNIRYFYVFSLAFVFQFYIGIYIGFFAIISFLLLLPFVIIYLIRNTAFKEFFSRTNITHLFFVLFISLALLLFLFEPYLSYKEVAGGRSWHEIESMLPRVESWLYSSGYFFEYFNTIGLGIPMQHEHSMFIGLLPIFLLFFIIYLFFKGNCKTLFVGYEKVLHSSLFLIVLVFIFTLYFEGFSLYKYTFYQIPGFDAIRAVSRIVLILVFPFAILLAFLITFVSKSFSSSKLKFFIIFIVIGFTLFEQYRIDIPVYEKKYAQERYLSLYEFTNENNQFDVFYLNRSKPSPSFFVDELDAMFLSLKINKPTINGYSGNIPLEYNLWGSNDLIYWLSQSKLDKEIRILILEGKEVEIYKK